MSPDKPHPERGDAFVRKLLTADPDALDVATDAQIERQMDAAGVDVGDAALAGLPENPPSSVSVPLRVPTVA